MGEPKLMLTAVVLFLFAASSGNQDDKAAEEALDSFKTAIKSTSEADRVTAVNDLARVHHLKTLARLASMLTTDGPTVRIASAKGISAFVELKRQAASALAAAMSANSKESTVHSALYEALGKLEEPSALPTLHRGFEEKETVVAKAAIQATGSVGNAASIEPLIALLAKQEKIQKSPGGSVDFTAPAPGGGGNVTVRSSDENPGKRAAELIPAINKALNEITRESNGSAETWNAWWAKNKATFKTIK
jgi:HEAT repeat protein